MNSAISTTTRKYVLSSLSQHMPTLGGSGAVLHETLAGGVDAVYIFGKFNYVRTLPAGCQSNKEAPHPP